MHGFLTGINAECRGYTADEFKPSMSPNGKMVGTLRIGCGGSEKRKATFVDVELWEKAAESVQGIADRKGLAVVAQGVISQKRWQYNNKWYEKVQLLFVSALQVEVDGKMVEIPIIREKNKAPAVVADDVPESVKPLAKQVKAVLKTKKLAPVVAGSGNGDEPGEDLNPDDVPF